MFGMHSAAPHALNRYRAAHANRVAAEITARLDALENSRPLHNSTQESVSSGSQNVELLLFHHNIFEDGLTDTPAAVGLSPQFTARATALLEAMSSADGDGNEPFVGFGKSRDFSLLPPVNQIRTPAALLAVLDVMYCLLYHPMGGEVTIDKTAPHLGNTLRTLFLHTSLQSDGNWHPYKFEPILQNIESSGQLSDTIRQIKTQVFEQQQGFLSWPRSLVQRLNKRTNNLWQDKWMKDLDIFLNDADAGFALTYFCTQKLLSDKSPMSSLIEVLTDDQGVPQMIKTMTLQKGILFLFECLSRHSISCPRAAEQIRLFVGADQLPDDAAGRAALIAPLLFEEIDSWVQVADLRNRHSIVCETINKFAPEIVTVVEYDQQWRKLAVAGARRYSSLCGRGQASIWWDADKFDCLKEFGPLEIPTEVFGTTTTDQAVGSYAQKKGWDLCAVRPKSSCIALLRNIEGDASHLVLVVVVHLESAKPSDTPKVTQNRRIALI